MDDAAGPSTKGLAKRFTLFEGSQGTTVKPNAGAA
jgi:hypothetical protein